MAVISGCRRICLCMDVESTTGTTVSVDNGDGVFTNCESIQIRCLQSDDGAAGLDLVVSLVVWGVPRVAVAVRI